MVLAACGTHVPEGELETQARMEKRGTPIDELERLARRYGVVAEIQDTTVEGLRLLLADGKLPIAFIDRAVFDLTPAERARHTLRDAILHTVIPVKITDTSVTLHDPRFSHATRRTVRLFRKAYDMLGGRSVVCSTADARSE
jgi:hypothetical protein